MFCACIFIVSRSMFHLLVMCVNRMRWNGRTISACKGQNYAPENCGLLRKLYHNFPPLRFAPDASVIQAA